MAHFMSRISWRAVAGQSLSNRIPCVSRKARTWHVTCSTVLSCWKMTFYRPPRQGITPGRVRHQKCINLHSSYCLSELDIVKPKAAQTITPGVGPQWQYHLQIGHLRSPWSLQTRTQPSEYRMQNRDPSEKMTFCHWCIKNFQLAQWSHSLSLCCIIKGSQSNGCQADRQHGCNCWCTIWAETG